MTRFLRDLVKAHGESCEEKEKVVRIKAEMEKLGCDETLVDPMGNILGYMGTGETIIAYDAHIDCVGIGNIEDWTVDPFEGAEDEVNIWGRGTSDQLGGIVSAVYGAKIMKDLGMLSDEYKVLVTGTVRRKIATACAGSISSTRTGSGRNLSYPRNPPTATSTGTPGTDGDPGGRIRPGQPWLSAGAGRQRHLQNGGHPPGSPGPQRQTGL